MEATEALVPPALPTRIRNSSVHRNVYNAPSVHYQTYRLSVEWTAFVISGITARMERHAQSVSMGNTKTRLAP